MYLKQDHSLVVYEEYLKMNHQIPLFHLQGQMELKHIHVQGVLLCFMVENIVVIAVKNLNGKTLQRTLRKVGDGMKRLKDLTRRERRELNRIVRKQRRKRHEGKEET